MNNEIAICPYCNKPAGPALKNAKISHGHCLYKQLEARRSQIPSDYGKKNGVVSNELRKNS